MNAPDPDFVSRVRQSFGRQKAMALIGASLKRVDAGAVEISKPGRGSLLAQGKVLRPGRTLTVARGEVYADDGSHVATMLQTLMALPGRPDTPE